MEQKARNLAFIFSVSFFKIISTKLLITHFEIKAECKSGFHLELTLSELLH